MNRSGRKLGYANVVATLALIVALSGSAYALTITGRDVQNGSLTGKDVRQHSLKGGDLHRGSVRSNQVKNSNLTKADMAYDAVSADDTQLIGKFVPAHILLTGADYTTLATINIDLTRKSDVLMSNNMLITSQVPLGTDSTTINYRLLIDGVASSQLPQDSLRDGDARRSNIAITMNKVVSGAHTIEIQAQIEGSDIDAGGRTVNVLTVPSS